MNQKILLAVGIFGPIALLITAFGFQYLGNLQPCTLCIWQRWPHVVAIIIGLLFLAFKLPIIAILVSLAFASNTGIAGFHAGVEFGWWEGLPSCTGSGIGHLSTDQLLDFTIPLQPSGCSTPAWKFLGLSMAVWNGIFSLILFFIWLSLAKLIKFNTP